MTANRQKYAVPFEIEPGCHIYLLPFKSLAWHVQYETLKDWLNRQNQEWLVFHDVFMLFGMLITGLEIDQGVEPPAWIVSLKDWLELRKGDVIEDWQTFQEYASSDNMDSMWKAFHGTRADLPLAPVAIQQPSPLPVDAKGEPSRPILPGGRKSVKRSSR